MFDTYLSATNFIANANPQLRMAIEMAMPDLDDILAETKKLSRPLRNQDAAAKASANAWAEFIEEHTGSIREGGSLPDDFAARALEAKNAGLEAAAALEALAAIRQDIEAGLPEIVNRIMPALLEHLGEQLADVISAGRALNLRGATTAEAAFELDVVDDWSQMIDLRTAHHDIRSAATTILTSKYGVDGNTVTSVGYFRNAINLNPHFANPRRTSGISQYGVALPWPADDDGKFLWTLAHPEAEPWIPTARQIQNASAIAALEADYAQNAKPDEQETPEQAAAARERTRILDLIDYTGTDNMAFPWREKRFGPVEPSNPTDGAPDLEAWKRRQDTIWPFTNDHHALGMGQTHD